MKQLYNIEFFFKDCLTTYYLKFSLRLVEKLTYQYIRNPFEKKLIILMSSEHEIQAYYGSRKDKHFINSTITVYVI